MKKTIIFSSLILFCILLLSCVTIGSGFTKNENVFLTDFKITDDNKNVIMNVEISNSIGNVRDYKDIGGGVKPHYLIFYNAYGGINGKIKAKNQFILPISENDSEIYFYHGDGSYSLVLYKDKLTNQWIMK